MIWKSIFQLLDLITQSVIYTLSSKMSSSRVYEVVIVGSGLIGSSAAKYAAEEFPDGNALLIGPGAGLNSFDHGIGWIYLMRVRRLLSFFYPWSPAMS